MNVVITGATKGIGRAIAVAFAKEGAGVAVCARTARGLDELGVLLNQIQPGIDYLGFQADCGEKQQLMQFCNAAAERFREVDVLVNNLGIYEPTPILEEPEGLLERMLSVNLLPAYHLSRFFAGGMKARKSGHIFNICSVASIQPSIKAGSYAISKYALLGLSDVLREAFRAYGVKVTAVLPGSTYTASWEGSGLEKSRFIDPDDIASAILNSFHMSKGAMVDHLRIVPTSGNI